MQTLEPGVQVSFAHDIYFEWAFYKLLLDANDTWIEVLKRAGEAPLLGRVVGLFSQRCFELDDSWLENYTLLDDEALRPQWRRDWLIGPTASGSFLTHFLRFETLILNDGNGELLDRFLT